MSGEKSGTRTVLQRTDGIQFALACQVLEASGIPFERHGRAIDSLDDPMADWPIQRLELRVREEDFERARALLADTVGRGMMDAL